jgi:hypothetical protein
VSAATTSERPPVADRLAAAAAARDEGMERVEQAADPRVMVAIDAAIERAIATRRPFSANDIRDEFPVADEHLVGARIRAYGQKRVDGEPLMTPVGYTPSTLKSTHKHPIRVWVGRPISQEPQA